MTYLPTGRALIDPFKALEAAEIKEEMKIADLGVGAVGHFLFPAAQLVGPKGTVYAVDILKSVLQANEGRQKLMGGLSNVEFIWGNVDKLKGTQLPDNSMDMVLIINVLHLASKGELLSEARRILHSTGRLLVVEWKPAGTTLGPAPDKRVSREKALELIKNAGFTIVKEFEAGGSHYGIVAEKPVG